jgi:hypothetical protein
MAAGNTYVALATNTLASAVGSVTFSSISGAYTDLVLVLNIKSTSSNYPTMILNSDGSSLYSTTALKGDGTTAASGRNSNTTVMYIAESATIPSDEFKFNSILHFMNYSNTTTNKTVLIRTNGTTTSVEAVVGLYRSTSAITAIQITASASTFAIGSTFTLYGIAAA